ncbi:hypothetical protein CK936_25775, partial [Streptomyces albireticuli]
PQQRSDPPASGLASEPRKEAPAPAPAPAKGGGNVCAMGRDYGRWQQGDDANRICGQVYGH